MTSPLLQRDPRPEVSAMPGKPGFKEQLDALTAWTKRNPPADVVSKPLDMVIPEGKKGSEMLGGQLD